MEPGDSRFAVLLVGLLFVILFAGMTLVVLAKDGFTILIFFSLIIVILLGIAVWGAINDDGSGR